MSEMSLEAMKAAAEERLLIGKYMDWEKAGGLNECDHGRAAGIPCPACDSLLVYGANPPDAKLAKPSPYPSNDVGTCADSSYPHCINSHGLCDMWSPLAKPSASEAREGGDEARCPQCHGLRDDPAEDSIERLLVCGASFHSNPATEKTESKPQDEPRMRFRPFSELRDELLKNPDIKAAYDALPDDPKLTDRSLAWAAGVSAKFEDALIHQPTAPIAVLPLHPPALSTEASVAATGGDFYLAYVDRDSLLRNTLKRVAELEARLAEAEASLKKYYEHDAGLARLLNCGEQHDSIAASVIVALEQKEEVEALNEELKLRQNEEICATCLTRYDKHSKTLHCPDSCKFVFTTSSESWLEKVSELQAKVEAWELTLGKAGCVKDRSVPCGWINRRAEEAEEELRVIRAAANIAFNSAADCGVEWQRRAETAEARVRQLENVINWTSPETLY